MNFSFDESLATGYKSSSQRIRVMSENWVQKNIYCPIAETPIFQKRKTINLFLTLNAKFAEKPLN